MATAPDVMLEAGACVRGFLVNDVTPLPGLRAVGYRLEHQASGARLFHVHTDDTENLFSVVFPTPPCDDTGMPHILEHAVLAGSRKFPVKEPFFEMVKMSMATFINAMTGPALTYYPVASNNAQDLFNLAEVYFDAVFHPLLTELTFKREAHHLRPAGEDAGAGLTTSGIVYSEMKGAFSDPEQILSRLSSVKLFPDTAYGFESGGDPDCIPNLTWEALKRFHETFYQPSNAFVFLYGDIPTERHMAFLEDRLKPFDRSDVRPALGRQPRWDTPRTHEECYPVAPGDPVKDKTYLMLKWIVGDAVDGGDFIAMDVLERILIGHEAAPLRKAIIDSKLGQDLVSSGFGPAGLDSVFQVGLKGSEVDRAEAFENLVIETLGRVADGDVRAQQVEAALQQASYDYLEIASMFPVHLMFDIARAWAFGADPLEFLRMQEHLDACRRRWQEDPKLFNRLIRERLLDNAHRLRTVLSPDGAEQARRDDAFAARMKDAREGLSDDQVRCIAEGAEALDRDAARPNPPEALATLPQLAVADLDRAPTHIETSVTRLDGGIEILRNEVFSNGINYLALDFDLTGLPEDLYAYLPHYCDAVRKLGAAGEDYAAIARRAAGCTGGVECRRYFTTHATDPQRSVRRLRIAVKTLDRQIEPALMLLRDLVFTLDPRDADRLRDVTVQACARRRADVVQDGSRLARAHAGRTLNVEGHLADIAGGLPQLKLVGALSDDFDTRGEDLARRIEGIRDFLLNRKRVTASFTGAPKAYDAICRALAGWSADMSDDELQDAPMAFVPRTEPLREGLAAPMDVAFCVTVMRAPHASDEDEPLMSLAARILSLDHLLGEIRFKGNAYGAGCRYESLTRAMMMYSFRDPHIKQTLDVFAGVRDYARNAKWTREDIDRAVIGKAKQDAEPIRPEAATHQALARYLIGHTREYRDARYARILAATPAAVKSALIRLLDAGFNTRSVCVVSSRERLEKANRRIAKNPLAIENVLT